MSARASPRRRWAAASALTVLTLAAAALPPPGAATAASPVSLVSLVSIPARYLTWYRDAARTCPGLS